MRYWFFRDAQGNRGPLTEPDLVALFRARLLAPGTPVWSEGLAEWTPADSVEALAPAFADEPGEAAGWAGTVPDFIPAGNQIRPWVRYWARMIDLGLFILLFETLMTAALMVRAPREFLVLWLALPAWVSSLMYVFVEPALLARWGTTPGKALLNVRVRREDGARPTYRQAIRRTADVFVRGLALNIPLLNLCTLSRSYLDLTRNGITRWDQEEGFLVTHRPLGPGRVGVLLLIVSLWALLAMLLAGN